MVRVNGAINKKLKWGIAALLVIFIAVTIFLLFRERIADLIFDGDNPPGHAVITPRQAERILFTGVGAMRMDTDCTYVVVKFENSEVNPCDFRVTVVLDEDESVLYQSSYIAPGTGVYEINLNRAFDKGVYPVSIRYDTYSVEDGTSMNGVTLKSVLVVGGGEK